MSRRIRHHDPLGLRCQSFDLGDHLLLDRGVEVVLLQPADAEQLLVVHHVALLERGGPRRIAAEAVADALGLQLLLHQICGAVIA